MFVELFAAFTWPFWLLVIGWLSLEILFTERESGIGTGLVAILFLFILTAFTDVNVFNYAAHNFDVILLLIIGYGLAGVLWGVVKWYFFVHKAYRNYEESEATYKSNYQEYLNPSNVTGPKSVAPANPMTYKDYLIDRRAVPTAKRNKSLIIFWMTNWPFSATWTLINDPVRAFFRFIYARLSKTYDNIVDHVFGF